MGLFDIFSNDDAEAAAAARRQGLQKGYEDLSTQYGLGRDALQSTYADSTKPLQTVFGQSQSGSQAYGDASGANGADGYARAKTNFQANPGYQFQFGQGLQAIDRGAASRGMVTSGNTLNAEQQFGTGLADQSYKGYLAGLQPYLTQGSSAASALGYLGANQGSQLNSSFMKQGDAANSNQTQQGEASAAAELNKYNVSGNLFNALMDGGKLAAAFI
jgi:hypothetical protein